ncbi:MAG TPA: cobalamin-independent methionine synthase II family protein [Dehalococcoidia bacterium]|nr:cobalamin-independent methionine synthase II family protein [Dehalococcoidia bacterium]
MYKSTDRILTTHAGSLPRPADLIELIRAREQGNPGDEAAFHTRVREAVAEVVQKQVDAGVDIVSDGEEGKPSYATYVKNRLTGFGGQRRMPIRIQGEAKDFPEYTERRMATTATLLTRPTCNGPIAWSDFESVSRDVDNFKAAVEASKPAGTFMTAASPGVVAFFLGNDYYKSDDEYLEALAAVMKDEFEAITNAGFELQIDCPDLAMSRQSQFADLSTADFRKIVQRHVEVVNEATKNIAPDKMRLHLCWGNYEGPHHMDIPMRDIADIVLTSRPYSISFEGANPRHEHEWNVWQDVKLPGDKVLVPGVIDSTTNFIEHPELVAQRIMNYARLVGRENVIAGVDCGFGTNAASTNVDPRIVWAKLATLAEGAALASKQLWS